MASRACSEGRPLNDPESARTPYSVKAFWAVAGSNESSSSEGRTTNRMGSSNFLANSKSRWSCAGTAITAPVPYPASTKLATHTGMVSLVKGFFTRMPVSMPSFSAAAAPSPTARAATRTFSAKAAISAFFAAGASFCTSGWSGAAAT